MTIRTTSKPSGIWWFDDFHGDFMWFFKVFHGETIRQTMGNSSAAPALRLMPNSETLPWSHSLKLQGSWENPTPTDSTTRGEKFNPKLPWSSWYFMGKSGWFPVSRFSQLFVKPLTQLIQLILIQLIQQTEGSCRKSGYGLWAVDAVGMEFLILWHFCEKICSLFIIDLETSHSSSRKLQPPKTWLADAIFWIRMAKRCFVRAWPHIFVDMVLFLFGD